MQTNLGCIYKFVVAKPNGAEVEQIAFGISESVSEGNEKVGIRFCPPKGAKPQKGKSPDTLYQDIRADIQFQLQYKSKCGPRVESEDKNIDRSVLLAFNLEITKDGSLGKKGSRGGQVYNASSYSVVASVIEKYYYYRNIACSWVHLTNKLLVRMPLHGFCSLATQLKTPVLEMLSFLLQFALKKPRMKLI